jgi:hypothetical protein
MYIDIYIVVVVVVVVVVFFHRTHYSFSFLFSPALNNEHNLSQFDTHQLNQQLIKWELLHQSVLCTKMQFYGFGRT